MFSVGCPAKEDSGTGAMAVYIYILKNLPYTVNMIMKDSTVTKSDPMIVTAQRGMLSKNPQSSMASTISWGRVVLEAAVMPDVLIILLTIPWITLKTPIIRLRPYVTTPLAIANLMNSFSACSGRLISPRLALVFTTPDKKKRTSKASPIACKDPLMLTITLHMPPPLKLSGDMERSCHTSASFSFQVFSVFTRCCTTQLSLILRFLLSWL